MFIVLAPIGTEFDVNEIYNETVQTNKETNSLHFLINVKRKRFFDPNEGRFNFVCKRER